MKTPVFPWKGRKIALLPLVPTCSPPPTPKLTKGVLLTVKVAQFQQVAKDSQFFLALLLKESVDVLSELPAEIQHMLTNFADVIPLDLPPELSPM